MDYSYLDAHEVRWGDGGVRAHREGVVRGVRVSEGRQRLSG